MRGEKKEVGKTDSQDKLIQLMNEYKNLVFSVCLKMTGDYFTAEDITQDTFISAYEHLSEFTGGSEKAWLCRIASNKCIDYLKAAERRTLPVAGDELPEDGDSGEGPIGLFATKDVLRQVEFGHAFLNADDIGIAAAFTQFFLDGAELFAQEKFPL